MHEEAIVGCLLGTAIGDALGLPYEGMTARRGGRVFPDRRRFHLLPGFGMVSDDTEHACLTARALLESGGDPDRFARSLARSLRWWLAGLPAGIGLATLRAVTKLWLGVPPDRSGVRSAGNGAAMRAPILGAAHAGPPAALRELVGRSTRITHTDPRAELGALAVAVAAQASAVAEATPEGYLARLDLHLAGEAGPSRQLVVRACASAARGEPVAAFAASLGCRGGITGFVDHTVPCVLQCWLRHPRDFLGGVTEIVAAGGDADTTGAILGGILGAGVGRAGLPGDLLARLAEWPRSVAWMERLGKALAGAQLAGAAVPVPGYPAVAVPARNALFTAIVLVHGLRRLLPPY